MYCYNVQVGYCHKESIQRRRKETIVKLETGLCRRSLLGRFSRLLLLLQTFSLSIVHSITIHPTRIGVRHVTCRRGS